MKKIGFTIGKFAPLHKGHQFLIETALREMDQVIVIIYETDLIDIPIDARANWIKKLYPSVDVKYAINPPSRYGLDKKSVEIQMKYLINILGDIKPTHFYSSEKYGEEVSKYLSITNRQVDSKREIIPISATDIRNDLEKQKDYLDKIVYQDIKEKI